MLPQLIAQTILDAVRAAQAAGRLAEFEPPAPDIDRPRSAEHGDLATNWALKAAKASGMAPLALAGIVVEFLSTDGPIHSASVAPPGFINVRLSPGWLSAQVALIRGQGAHFGELDIGAGERLQVEFVSANPTGPLHFGGSRNAAIGDTLARVLEAAGYRVQREFYINDSGNQVRKFGASIYARYAQALGRDVPLPEDGYQGDYVADYAAQIIAEEGERFLAMEPEAAAEALGRWGIDHVLAQLEINLGRLNIRFDRWFSEASLYTDGTFDAVMAEMRAKDLIFNRDGAEWLATQRFGSDRDEVLIRGSGEPGYFASDLAYHYDKFIRRGFDRVVNVWAVDHQNQARRMPHLMAALGLDPARLEIVIYDLVKLVETVVDEASGEASRQESKQSKRRGVFTSLDEVLDVYQVPPDAIRFMLITRSNEQAMDFDPELVKQATNENPVYYVQYAHARICSILRQAAERGIPLPDGGSSDPSLPRQVQELTLIRQMLRLPEVIAQVTTFLAPHHLPHFAMELAASFHAFYHDCPVLAAGEPALVTARLELVDAARMVLARALDLMGVSAPERM